MKNTLDFIKKSKQLVVTDMDLVKSGDNDIRNILSVAMRRDIITTQGDEFDLYLKGLFYRDFDIPTIPL